VGNQQQARAHDGLARTYYADAGYEQAREYWERSLAIYTEMRTPEADKIRAQLAGIQAGASPAHPTAETAPLNNYVREDADHSQSRSA
jgi:hypothetical protein